MSDLIQRASQALSLLSDSSLAKHLRIERAMQSFSGLVLSDLDRDIRDELEHNLGGVMAVTQATTSRKVNRWNASKKRISTDAPICFARLRKTPSTQSANG